MPGRLKVDCWPSEALLGHLRNAAATEKAAQPAAVKDALGAKAVEVK